MKVNIFYIFSLLLFASCSQRNVAYMSDLQESNTSPLFIANSHDVKIQPNDLLDIVISNINTEANALFNTGVLLTGSTGSNNSVDKINVGYLVNKEGFINFPVIGKLQLGGLTKEEATDKITSILKNEYIKDPIVNIRFLNFKVTVIGEVNDPTTFTITAERITILEALGYAGDMTIYGKRDNVLVIREVDGKRNIGRVDLNSKDVLNSEFYYLRQNDVVYVEPNKAKQAQANTNTRGLAIASLAVSLLGAIIFATR